MATPTKKKTASTGSRTSAKSSASAKSPSKTTAKTAVKSSASKSATARSTTTTSPRSVNRGTATSSRSSANSNTARSTDDSMLMEFFVDGIKDIYWAEKALLKALPKMKKAATSPELQAAFQDHFDVTALQSERLEQVFQLLGKPARAKKCEAMEGLIKEGESIIEDTEKAPPPAMSV